MSLFLQENMAQTVQEVNGTISTNTVWNADTIKVIGDITVNNGVTLTINPGTCVEFRGYFAIDISGCLKAEGKKDSVIVFTCHDTSGFYNSATNEIGWKGIRFDETEESNPESRIRYCILEYGKADKGGAVYLNSYSSLLIEYSTLRSCIASYSGGGVFAQKGNLCIRYSDVSNNNAPIGGGIDFETWDYNCILIGNKICNNYAVADGGGIAISTNDSESIIVNNIIANNKANGGMGGGIYITGSGPWILNNTIVRNSSVNGGGVGFHDFLDCIITIPKLTNNIIRSNIGSQIYPDPPSTMTVEYCNISGEYPGTGNIDLDPVFMDPSDCYGNACDGTVANWDIGSDSPCINAGDPEYTWESSGIFKDIRGLDRVSYDTVDIGAYEYVLINEIPCHIEAEDYYSMSGDMVVEESGDLNGGYSINYIEDGNLISYPVKVNTAGNYILNLRIAADNGDGSVIACWAGEIPINTESIPYTVSRNNFVSLPLKIELPQVTQYFGLYFNGTSYIANLNYLEILEPNSVSVSIPAKIEAENFNDFLGVVKGWYYSGDGTEEYIGWIDEGDYAEYKINVPETGYYPIAISAAAVSDEGLIRVLANGTMVAEIPVVNTDGWEVFTSLTGEIYLTEGENNLQLSFQGLESGICNVDYLEVGQSTGNIDQPFSDPGIKIFPNPASKEINIVSTPDKTLQRVELIDITGKIIAVHNNIDNYRYSVKDLKGFNGTYILKIYAVGYHVYKKINIIQ